MTDSTYHRYPKQSVVGDLVRAGIGLLFFGLPLVFTDLGPVMFVILGAFALFFLGFGVRTILHQWTVFEFSEIGFAKHGPTGARIAWESLSAVKLRYFSTGKDRPRAGAGGMGGGWMEMTLEGDNRKLKFDSELDGFERIAKEVEKQANGRKIDLDESTKANFRALRGEIGPGDKDDPRTKAPYPDNYRSPGI